MKRSLLAVGLGVGILFWVQGYVGGQKVAPSPDDIVVTTSSTVPANVQQPVTLEQALAQARLVGKPVPVTITLTETQLTAAAAARFPLTYAGASLTDPVVRLRNGQLFLDSAASFAFIRTTASVVTTPAVTAGRPSVRIDSATLAGQPVPATVRDSLAVNLASAIASDVPSNLVVSSITVGAGTLTVQGTANP